MGYNEITNIKNTLLIMVIALIACLIIMLMFIIIFIKRRKLLKQNTIKEYLKEYFEKYFNSQLLEMDTKILSDETQQVSLILVFGTMLFLGLVYGLIEYYGLTRIQHIPIGILICGILVISVICMKVPGVKKIKLKNNVIELHNSNNEIKSYQLEKINIKYNMRTRRYTRYINIFFNEDKYSSYWYGLQNYTPYIAFVIFVNLLKRHEIEKINNLDDDEIERLQQNFTHNEDSKY